MYIVKVRFYMTTPVFPRHIQSRTCLVRADDSEHVLSKLEMYLKNRYGANEITDTEIGKLNTGVCGIFLTDIID